MLKSMTAFGRARRTSEDMSLDITVEIKSVNSRFLDCSVKISRMFSFLEEKVRSHLTSSGVLRGKVEVYIGVDVIEKRGGEVMLDTEAAKSYIDALCKLRDTFGLTDDISVMSVAQNRDLFTMRKPDDDAEKDWNDIRPVLDEALAGYNQMREREGINLCTDILGKAENIKASAEKIKELSAADIQGYPAKLEARIRQLLSDFDVQTSEQRILTEAAIYADKVAVDEETVRLRSHVAQLRGMLESDEPMGRKMDFLIQEVNRESNTIGSKCSDVSIAQVVVGLKAEVEKMREQVQNVE